MYSTETYLGTTCSGPTGPVGPPPVGGGSTEIVIYDCAGVPNGTASDNNPCNTCMGGTTGITECPRKIIATDTSITNNTKINCLIKKLLGLDGTTGNAQIKALLTAFNNKGFDVTFKIGSTQANSKGETSADPNDPTKYNIVLNRNKISAESQMSWVKTLLHEAFHANLMQKTYELFGSAAVAIWDKKPGEMSMNELMDYTSMKAVASGNPILLAAHHNFMAENFAIIRDGLKSFSLANNSNHNQFNDYHFEGLAYEGVHESSYYLNTVIKNSDGSTKMVDFFGTPTAINTVYVTLNTMIQEDSSIPCN